MIRHFDINCFCKEYKSIRLLVEWNCLFSHNDWIETDFYVIQVGPAITTKDFILNENKLHDIIPLRKRFYEMWNCVGNDFGKVRKWMIKNDDSYDLVFVSFVAPSIFA